MESIGNSHFLSSSIEKITLNYNKLWEDSKYDLAKGFVESDPEPCAGSARWGISAVIRITGGLANVLEKAAIGLTEFTGRQQVVYNTTNLHTTLRSIEPYRIDITDNDERVQAYTQILRAIAQQYNSFRILYKGLTANKTGVLVQGWPIGDDFQAIRLAFHSKLHDHHLLSGPEDQNLRQTAHTSLIVFSSPLPYPKLFVEFIETNRHLGYGIMTVTSFEVVRYKRTASDVELVTLEKISLCE